LQLVNFARNASMTMDDPQESDPVDLDHPEVDVDMVATDQSAFVAKGNGGMGSEFVLYSVDDDIIPRQYRRLVSGQHQEHLYGNYDYLGGWSERVRNTSGILLTYVLPVLIVTFIVGALLTGNLRELCDILALISR
jgi:hypothetical protein